MAKNSFTLIETLISITLLAIVISGFLNSSYYDEKNHKNFMLLNNLENKFNTQTYNEFTKISTSIKIVKNETNIENINVSKYQFENEDIKIFKY
ncbi:MAG: prepilin-type N-terminal cleavage/methylation domain-containing protein, partial [Aliarcobacter sp.]|nr:prepilin-type N-terminal cleavage/methylation domain-containing protein [Aliarcobacter sp.]